MNLFIIYPPDPSGIQPWLAGKWTICKYVYVIFLAIKLHSVRGVSTAMFDYQRVTHVFIIMCLKKGTQLWVPKWRNSYETHLGSLFGVPNGKKFI